MTIKRKFVLCGLLVFVALGAIGIGTGFAVRNAQHDQVRSSLAAVANLEASRVEDLLERSSARLQNEVRRQEFAASLESATAPGEERFADVLASDPNLRAVSLVRRDGSVLASAPDSGERTAQPVDPEQLAAAVDSLELGEPFAVGSATRVAAGDERYTLFVPVTGPDNDSVGYLAAEYDLAPIQKLFGRHEELGTTAEAHLVQQTPDGAELITDLRFQDDARFDLVVPRTDTDKPEILAAYGTPGTYDGLRDYRNHEVIASVRHIVNTPWALVVKIDGSEAYASFNRAMFLGGVGFVAAAVFSIGALVVASQSVLRRVRRIAESASAISAGDLTARVSDLNRDELGRLSRAFDQMADTLVADMARRHEVEAELAHRARHDVLTGLPNRSAFQHELKAALSVADPDSVAVLFCDLDEFKTVNDDLGHTAGDTLLREVTARLRRAVTDRHVLARFGGDEFVVVARDLDQPSQALDLAHRIVAELGAPIGLGGRDVFVTTSVGVALNTLGSTAETLIRDADAAMYQAKSKGRARVAMHDAGIGARATNRLAMTTELHLAIANGGLDVALQPIAELETGAPHAFEVLVRWRHEGREIDPSEFVMRATELDLAGALDRWVLNTSCKLMADLRGTTDSRKGWLHVNVTGTSLVDEQFADDVLNVLATHQVMPSELCLEIVEDRLGGAPHAALSTLARLRDAGVRVAIDDFGTGHSSLARLRDLPADTVKIDQSFIRELSADPASLAITGSIISLAERLGLEIVAEGVEDADSAAQLRLLGCRYGQGFHFGAPRRADEVVAEYGREAPVSGLPTASR